PPRESLASARCLWTFVGFAGDPPGAVRWVRDRVLTHAVLDGYESLVVKGRYPAAVVIVRVPRASMDVNVHPAKLEVRFQRSAVVHQCVASAIRSRLRAALAPVPTVSGVGAATVAAEASTPYAETGGVAALPLARDGTQGALWQPAAQGFRRLRFVG